MKRLDQGILCLVGIASLVAAIVSFRASSRLSTLQFKDIIMHDPLVLFANTNNRPLVLLPSPGATNRSQRFPSLEERLQVYLGHWYNCVSTTTSMNNDDNHTMSPSLWYYEYQNNGNVVVLTSAAQDNGDNQHNNSQQHSSASFPVSNDASLGIQQALFVDRAKIQACADSPNKPTRYCKDVIQTVLPVMDQFTTTNNKSHEPPPVLMRFGDTLQQTPFPLIQKFRPAHVQACDLSHQRKYPIIWKLNTDRHYAMLDQVAPRDVYWHDKLPRAVFRGAHSGERIKADVSQLQKCQQSRRCRFVYNHANSTLVDAKLVSVKGGLQAMVEGRPILGNKLSMAEMMQYKGHIILEGNDVATGLKWSLLSRSVVLMPPPTKTSWAMEELLQPWVHYVPLQPDGKDAASKMQWVLDHDDEAQEIAHRGSLWMQDLLESDADGHIFQALMERYRVYFVPRRVSSG